MFFRTRGSGVVMLAGFSREREREIEKQTKGQELNSTNSWISQRESIWKQLLKKNTYNNNNNQVRDSFLDRRNNLNTKPPTIFTHLRKRNTSYLPSSTIWTGDIIEERIKSRFQSRCRCTKIEPKILKWKTACSHDDIGTVMRWWNYSTLTMRVEMFCN